MDSREDCQCCLIVVGDGLLVPPLSGGHTPGPVGTSTCLVYLNVADDWLRPVDSTVRCPTMSLILTINRATSTRLAEVAYLLILIAGIWIVVSEIPKLKLHTVRMVVAGIALGLAGLLLLIATHWGKLG